MKKISLCVTAYKRIDTLEQLIHSYQKQTYPYKELVISDDTPDDTVKKLVSKYRKDRTIVYFHNKKSLRFPGNLLASMKRATGDFLLLLGDDDILLYENVFELYVKNFISHPSVGFIYSNMVQFGDNLDVQYILKFTDKDILFKRGFDSMANMLIRSIFIGGIGLRNIKRQFSYYPKEKILHPQVEFIGNIINKQDSLLLADYNIGFRSHEEQIIFRALQNSTERQDGNPMTVEIPYIFNKLNIKYDLNMNVSVIIKQLMSLQEIMMFKEKVALGSKAMDFMYKNFSQQSEIIKKSKRFTIAYLLAKHLPSSIIKYLRLAMIHIVTLKNKNSFRIFENQIQKMIA